MEYEKVLEDENARLHNELEVLRGLLYGLGPKMCKMLTDIEKDVDRVNSGYYEVFVGCNIIKKKLSAERKFIEEELKTK